MPTQLPTLPSVTLIDGVRQEILSFPWRPELEVSEIPAPQRIAPHSFALEASVYATSDEEVGTARLIILHDPAGNSAWDGTFRCVSLTRADVDMDMVTDPAMTEVGWSWLTEALDEQHASYHDESGTVTCQSSQAFGELSGEPMHGEVEIRASWTADITAPSDIVPHLQAWQNLACIISGLPPLAQGIIPLTSRIQR